MEVENWRLIEDGLSDGGLNMAVDRALLIACEEGKAPPTLRIYGWNHPTLSLGYSQDLSREVDRVRCRELGVPVIRRPTGGRALLHHRELTYSLVAPVPHPRFPSNLRGTFQAISGAILHSLEVLGVRGAVMARNNGSPLRNRERGGRSPACFASLNHCEITVENKKLAGSAQRRTHKAFLQHGSVLLDCDPELMTTLLRFDSPEERRKNREHLARHVTTLNEVCGKPVRFEDAVRAFKAGFQKSFPGNWVDGVLTPLEIELRDRLLASDSLGLD